MNFIFNHNIYIQIIPSLYFTYNITENLESPSEELWSISVSGRLKKIII